MISKRIIKQVPVLLILFFLEAASCAGSDETNPWNGSRLNLDLLGAVQGEKGVYRELAVVPARLRLSATLPFEDSLKFNIRLTACSGPDRLAETGEYLPVNDIARQWQNYLDSHNEIDHSRWSDTAPVDANPLFDVINLDWQIASNFLVAIGLLETRSFDENGQGFASNRVALDERTGFINGHFTRTAGLPFLDQESFPTIPAIAMKYRPWDWYDLKFILTFGDVGEHIFFRNTWGIESHFDFGSGNYRLLVGCTDTHYSYTHHVAPCGGIDFDQKLFGGVYIFGSYGITENHKVSRFFSSIHQDIHGGFGFAMDAGTPETSASYIGVAAGAAQAFGSGAVERAGEVFWRMRLTERIELTPDIQTIFLPAGHTEHEQRYMTVGTFRFHVSW